MGDEYGTDVVSTDLSDSPDTSTFETADTSEPSDSFTEDTSFELAEDTYTSETENNFEGTDDLVSEDNIDYDNEESDSIVEDDIVEDSYDEESEILSENENDYISEDVEVEENTFQSDESEELREDIADEYNEDDPPKVLKRDEFDLLKTGNDAVNKRLEAQADDYRDKGFSEEEIETRLEEDKRNFQKEYLEDAFPGQEVSPNVFNGFSEEEKKELSPQTDDGMDEQIDSDEHESNDILDEEIIESRYADSDKCADSGVEDDVQAQELEKLPDIATNESENYADDSTHLDTVDYGVDAEKNVDYEQSEFEENLIEDDCDENYGETLDADNLIKDLVDQNVSKSVLPHNGTWSDESRIGNSDYIISDDSEIKWNKNGLSHSCSGKELKDWMEENYGVSSVTYDHKEPDFSPFEDKNIGEIRVEDMSANRKGIDGTFQYAEAVAAEKMGMSTAELKKYMSDNELTWHECADRHTIRAIPTRINTAYKHSGGISVQKSMESMATTLSEQHEGVSFSLQRESKLGYTEGTQDAIAQQKKNFRQAKKQLFGKKGGK